MEDVVFFFVQIIWRTLCISGIYTANILCNYGPMVFNKKIAVILEFIAVILYNGNQPTK